jgi:hypothetical protein
MFVYSNIEFLLAIQILNYENKTQTNGHSTT